MKKLLCALIAVISVCSVALTSCGSSESNSKADTASNSSVEKANTDTKKDVVAIADKLHDEITFVDKLNKFEDEKKEKQIKKILNIEKDLYANAQLYIGSGGATAEEIACFEAVDSNAAAKIKEALEKRVEAQKKNFENYQPKEMTKLGDPVIKVEGNYVFMCISDDNAKAEEIIG